MQRKLRLGVNPIIVKELRSRMRGGRAFATLTGVLIMLGLISYGLFRMVMVTSRYSTSPLSPQVGQTLFAGLMFLELLMVCAVTPAVTAGAISSEKEKLTYEMLLATPLRPASILWGKLISALSYVFLLIFAAVPMASLVFIFGGVAPRDMVKALLVLVTVAVMLGVIGLFMSALFGRTGRATVLSYLTVGLLLFGPTFIAVAVGVIRQSEPARWILIPGPINALSSALTSTVAQDSPTAIFQLLGGYFPWGMVEAPVGINSIPRPLYHYSLPFFGAVTLVLYLLSIRLVQPAHRWRIRWQEGLVALVLLLIYGGLVGLAFLASSDRYENYSLFNQPGSQVQVERAREVFESQPMLYPPPISEPAVTPTPAEPHEPYPPPPATLEEQDRSIGGVRNSGVEWID